MKSRVNRAIAVRNFVEAERLLEEFILGECPEDDLTAFTALLDHVRPRAAEAKPSAFWSWLTRGRVRV